MDKDKFKQLEEASKPLIEFLRKYYNPHTIVIIQEGRVDVYEGSMSMPLEVQD